MRSSPLSHQITRVLFNQLNVVLLHITSAQLCLFRFPRIPVHCKPWRETPNETVSRFQRPYLEPIIFFGLFVISRILWGRPQFGKEIWRRFLGPRAVIKSPAKKGGPRLEAQLFVGLDRIQSAFPELVGCIFFANPMPRPSWGACTVSPHALSAPPCQGRAQLQTAIATQRSTHIPVRHSL